MRVEEAGIKIDSVLDQAVLQGLRDLKIVHGTGSGALRSFLRDRLKVNPLVKEIKVSSIYVTSDDHAENENFTAMLSFSDGSIGSLTYTSLGTSKYPKEILNIYVDKDVLVMTDYNQLESHGLSKKNIQFNKVEKGHYEEMTAFTNALMSGGEWPIPLWQQIQASRIALKVEEQIVTGFTST